MALIIEVIISTCSTNQPCTIDFQHHACLKWAATSQAPGTHSGGHSPMHLHPGCGVLTIFIKMLQAHLAIFLTAYPSIESCTIYNRTSNARLESLRELLESTYPSVKVTTGVLPPAHSKEGELVYHEAVKRANIIITATSSTRPLFPSKLVQQGTHLCLIGSYKPEMYVRGRGSQRKCVYADTAAPPGVQARDRHRPCTTSGCGHR